MATRVQFRATVSAVNVRSLKDDRSVQIMCQSRDKASVREERTREDACNQNDVQPVG